VGPNMVSWDSLTDLVRDFRLNANPDDRDAVRRELRKALAAIHPDRNGGKFARPEDETRYQRLTEVMEYVERTRSTALVPISEIPALVAAIRQAIESSPAQARTEFRELARVQLHDRLTLPRVGSGVFAAICGFLLTFDDKFKDDPLFGFWVKSGTGRMTTAVALFYSALLFIMTWWMEQRAAAQAEWLATEEGRRAVLSRVLHKAASRSTASKRAKRFSFSDVVAQIRERTMHGPFPLLFLTRRLSLAAAEKLAKANLDELEARGILRKVDSKRLDILYEIDSDAVEETLN
jgi:hypothetical protein